MANRKSYNDYTDRELIESILSGNEEAALYLIYKRYYRDFRYLCFDCYGSHEYIDDLCHEVYLLLKGKNGDWKPLQSWQGLSSFRTWLNRVVRNMFLKNRS